VGDGDEAIYYPARISVQPLAIASSIVAFNFSISAIFSLGSSWTIPVLSSIKSFAVWAGSPAIIPNRPRGRETNRKITLMMPAIVNVVRPAVERQKSVGNPCL